MLAATLFGAACATSVESGVPLADPAAIAARLGSETAAPSPATIRFSWRYGDRRGDVEGDGADSGSGPRAYVAGKDSVLVYGPPGAATQVFYLSGGRLTAVEDRRNDRVRRRVRIEWAEAGRWPIEAEFRDFERPSRVRWNIEQVESPVTRHPSEIYALPYPQ